MRIKKSQRARRRHCERDDQEAARGEDLHFNELFSGTISGSDGVFKLVEGGEIGALEEAGCGPDYRDQKLPSNSADIGDVKVVRIMYPPVLGERKRARKVEETAYWWIGWDNLPALATDGDEHDTGTLGMARGKESCDETRNGGKTHNVRGKLGYPEGLR